MDSPLKVTVKEIQWCGEACFGREMDFFSRPWEEIVDYPLNFFLFIFDPLQILFFTFIFCILN
jgi:hypothetical protein